MIYAMEQSTITTADHTENVFEKNEAKIGGETKHGFERPLVYNAEMIHHTLSSSSMSPATCRRGSEIVQNLTRISYPDLDHIDDLQLVDPDPSICHEMLCRICIDMPYPKHGCRHYPCGALVLASIEFLRGRERPLFFTLSTPRCSLRTAERARMPETALLSASHIFIFLLFQN